MTLLRLTAGRDQFGDSGGAAAPPATAVTATQQQASPGETSHQHRVIFQHEAKRQRCQSNGHDEETEAEPRVQ